MERTLWVGCVMAGLMGCGPSTEELAAQREAAEAAARRLVIDDWMRSVDRVLANVERTGEITEDEDAALQLPAGCSLVFADCQNALAEVTPRRERARTLLTWNAACGLLKGNEGFLRQEGSMIFADEYAKLREAADIARQTPADCSEQLCFESKLEEVRQFCALVDSRANDALRFVGSTREARLLYADLRESRTRFHVPDVNIVADDYYNCTFRSSSRWRAFAIATPGDRGMHVYCRRGADWCDSLFSRLVSPASISAIALEFPRYNRICEEDQAELILVRERSPF